ncbi:aldo/keto reductase [Roseovarius pacificus]|uniref:aldo/keto reductase n=1 Tax=Roseovarius pacificus TaxID=337701 RepID=UPI002A18DA22|nr:aldo/keto reductase [Roseovarius pacificus]
MDLRSLGTSDIKVTPIGLGCWQFSNRVGFGGLFWPGLEQEVSREIVRLSLVGGVNWFDTAEIYGNGTSEGRLADGLINAGKKPGDVIVATKWHPLFRTAKHMLKTIDERKQHLSPFPIDLYQIHAPVSFSSAAGEAAALAQLVKEGHVRAVGVSNYNAKQMRAIHAALAKLGVPMVSNQVEYSMLKRGIESNGLMEAAKELGITIIAYSPLAQGLLTGKFHDAPSLLKNAGFRRIKRLYRPSWMEKSKPVVAALKSMAEKYEATPGQIALNWLIHFHGETVVAIPGAMKAHQAQQNTGAMAFKLNAEELARLDELSRGFM